MKTTLTTMLSLSVLSVALTACGSDTEKTTIVHDRPIVVEQPATTSTPVIVHEHDD